MVPHITHNTTATNESTATPTLPQSPVAIPAKPSQILQHIANHNAPRLLKQPSLPRRLRGYSLLTIQ